LLNDIGAAGGRAFKSFALAIRAFGPDHYHSGMLYQTKDGQVMLLHLADNFDLRNEAPSERYKWAEPSLTTSRCKLLAVLCAKIASQDPKIPYGFDKTGISINSSTGAVTPGPEGKGLTCASFIMATLDAYGMRLLKEDEWPRNSHEQWQNATIERLKAREEVTEEQLAALQKDTGACRFVPQEVVGASTAKPWPVGYEKATMLGIVLQTHLPN